jgi:hypothetical protein
MTRSVIAALMALLFPSHGIVLVFAQRRAAGPDEIVVNGEIVRMQKAVNRKAAEGGFESDLDEAIEIDGSSWLVVRCFEERADRRVRFAHGSGPHRRAREAAVAPKGRDRVLDPAG